MVKLTENAAQEVFPWAMNLPQRTSLARIRSARRASRSSPSHCSLYPRFASGEIEPFLFQAALVVLGVATFSFVFASLHYYGASLGGRMDDAERAVYSRRGDRFWLLGYTLLFLDPIIILFSVRLVAVGSAWFALWLLYLLFVIRYFPRVQTAPKSPV